MSSLYVRGFVSTFVPCATAAVLGILAAGSAPAIAQDATAAAPRRSTPESFAELVEGKLPAVVNISTTVRAEQQPGPDAPQLPPGSPLEELFRDFFGDLAPRRSRPMNALGSGFIIAPDGYVVTNNHVIENASDVTVVLQDDTELTAKVVGRDTRTDLALLKVESENPLPAVEWGDSTGLRVGDWVVAVGNPFGLGGTVTAGIVSATARDIQAGPYDDFLQTDASINRGNSGGPLFGSDGRVVGVNTAIFSPTGGNIGIGFAIPSATAQRIVAELRRTGTVERGWLGVQLQAITPELASSLNLPDRRGALVSQVMPGSPATASDLQPGDMIVEYNGEPVRDGRALARMVATTDPGTQAQLTILRNGQRRTETVRIARLQDEVRQAQARGEQSGSGGPTAGQLGLRLAPLTPDLRERLGIADDTAGVAVVGVAPGSVAAERGLRTGDVIRRVGQQAVTQPDQVASAVEEARKQGRTSLPVLVQRGDQSMFVPVPLAGNRG